MAKKNGSGALSQLQSVQRRLAEAQRQIENLKRERDGAFTREQQANQHEQALVVQVANLTAELSAMLVRAETAEQEREEAKNKLEEVDRLYSRYRSRWAGAMRKVANLWKELADTRCQAEQSATTVVELVEQLEARDSRIASMSRGINRLRQRNELRKKLTGDWKPGKIISCISLVEKAS